MNIRAHAEESRWLLSVTEHIHQMREGLAAMYADPRFVLGVDLTPRMDHQLLKMRGYMAKIMPGVEVL